MYTACSFWFHLLLQKLSEKQKFFLIIPVVIMVSSLLVSKKLTSLLFNATTLDELNCLGRGY